MSEQPRLRSGPSPDMTATRPRASLLAVTTITDGRGSLAFGQLDYPLPFQPKRYFMIFDVPPGARRGEHAHRQCQEFLVCASGSCDVIVEDGLHSHKFSLSGPRTGLYLPPMVWRTMENFSPDAVLVVLASDPYDEADYVRDHAEFLKLVCATS